MTDEQLEELEKNIGVSIFPDWLRNMGGGFTGADFIIRAALIRQQERDALKELLTYLEGQIERTRVVMDALKQGPALVVDDAAIQRGLRMASELGYRMGGLLAGKTHVAEITAVIKAALTPPEPEPEIPFTDEMLAAWFATTGHVGDKSFVRDYLAKIYRAVAKADPSRKQP